MVAAYLLPAGEVPWQAFSKRHEDLSEQNTLPVHKSLVSFDIAGRLEHQARTPPPMLASSNNVEPRLSHSLW